MNAKLTAYALHELPPDERAELEAQMKSDPALRKEAAEMQAFCAMLSEEVAGDSTPALTPQQRSSVIRAFSHEPAEKQTARPFWKRPAFFVPATLAACVAVAMVKLSDDAKHTPEQPEVNVALLAEKLQHRTALPKPLPNAPVEKPADVARANQPPLPSLPAPVLPGAATQESLVAGNSLMTAPTGTISLSQSAALTPAVVPAEPALRFAGVNEMKFGEDRRLAEMDELARGRNVDGYITLGGTVAESKNKADAHGDAAAGRMLNRSLNVTGTTDDYGILPFGTSNAGATTFAREGERAALADGSATMTGNGGITKSGAGTLTLNGGNTFTGGTTVSGGTLSLGNESVVAGKEAAANVTATNGTPMITNASGTAGGFGASGTGGGLGKATPPQNPAPQPTIAALSIAAPAPAKPASAPSGPKAAETPVPQVTVGYDSNHAFRGTQVQSGSSVAHNTGMAPATTTPLSTTSAAAGGAALAPVATAASTPAPDSMHDKLAIASPTPTAEKQLKELEQLKKIEDRFYFERKEQEVRFERAKREASGETYTRIYENPFLFTAQQPLSTFSIDVDTASYANVRRFLNEGQRPPPDAVRLEELINYFPYSYEGPSDGRPFGVMVDVAETPWQPLHRLVRVALKGREVKEERGTANFVFLVDVSGSMDSPDKLPLVQRSLEMLTRQLGESDRVALVVYAGNSGLVLPSTTGNNRETILDAIANLKAGGSTNGASGIKLAYQEAAKHFVKGGVNRVILCTDGDFNVGLSTPEELEKLIAEKAKSRIFLSVLGFGTGNLKDRTMETLADKGNGNYAYIDSLSEARKVLVEQMNGTLVTIAKDVKIQVEFNPAQVAAYRLLGYENRLLAKEDFNNDKKDAGEIGAGHTVTALYEVVPANVKFPDGKPLVDDLKYAANAPKPAAPAPVADAPASNEMMTVKLRYKQPEGDKSDLIEVPVTDKEKKLAESPRDFQFAASVAGFGMLLRGSQHAGELTWDMVREMALRGKGDDAQGYRGEFLQLIDKARGLTETRQ